MSTAVGHGLADPKSRGKPVSYANKGRRAYSLVGGIDLFGETQVGRLLLEGGFKTHATPVSKGIPVKIPEPEGWTECHSHFSLGFFFLV